MFHPGLRNHTLIKRNTIVLALIGVAVLVLGLKAMNKTPADAAVVAADPQVQKIAAANTRFGFGMLEQLSHHDPGKNVFFSPFSVTSALTLALNGAGGATRQSIASTLGLPPMTNDQINHANGLLLPSLENPDPKVELSVANALWANTGTTFAASFQETCRKYYGASAQTLPFASPSAADTINGWVKEKTHGKIDNLVTPRAISASTAVLTNAVYFHGQWSRAFQKSATHDAPFTLPSGDVKTVPLMCQQASFAYLETPRFQAASLPYGEGRMSLYVFLPKPGTSLSGLVAGMNADTWDGWMGQMKPTPMVIFLPKFQVSYQATLNQPLIALGMGPAFGPEADFAPMGLHGSFISAVIHEATLDVDEDGTVAAASTAVIMSRAARPMPTTVMRVDHPFFCAIRDNATGTLLFAGVIEDPR